MLSGAKVIGKTADELAVALIASSKVLWLMCFTETLVLPGSPLYGASAPSSLAV